MSWVNVVGERIFSVEPWAVTENELHLDALARSESVFALSNGHIGLRGNLDEGDPHGVPGTYLNGVFETVPLPYAESGYGYPEEGQSLIDVTNGKLLRLPADCIHLSGHLCFSLLFLFKDFQFRAHNFVNGFIFAFRLPAQLF